MEYIMIAIMIIVGLIGIIKNKWPKYENGLGFAINANFFFIYCRDRYVSNKNSSMITVNNQWRIE
jgi:hypothetical protein